MRPLSILKNKKFTSIIESGLLIYLSGGVSIYSECQFIIKLNLGFYLLGSQNKSFR